eukprot:TRINITY_DN21418_c0_g1_i1.p2 TRINITY_DN21418_c0_g1~~TRINITY_DN21418_c0_g1_i1.p2  ORF type:complete len:449 (+),score=122.28 TRINITY_DN21418_c0_g1_i1:1646-2992(+)
MSRQFVDKMKQPQSPSKPGTMALPRLDLLDLNKSKEQTDQKVQPFLSALKRDPKSAAPTKQWDQKVTFDSVFGVKKEEDEDMELMQGDDQDSETFRDFVKKAREAKEEQEDYKEYADIIKQAKEGIRFLKSDEPVEPEPLEVEDINRDWKEWGPSIHDKFLRPFDPYHPAYNGVRGRVRREDYLRIPYEEIDAQYQKMKYESDILVKTREQYGNNPPETTAFLDDESEDYHPGIFRHAIRILEDWAPAIYDERFRLREYAYQIRKRRSHLGAIRALRRAQKEALPKLDLPEPPKYQKPGHHFWEIMRRIPEDHPMKEHLEFQSRLIARNGHWSYNEKKSMIYFLVKNIVSGTPMEFEPGSEIYGIPESKGTFFLTPEGPKIFPPKPKEGNWLFEYANGKGAWVETDSPVGDAGFFEEIIEENLDDDEFDEDQKRATGGDDSDFDSDDD